MTRGRKPRTTEIYKRSYEFDAETVAAIEELRERLGVSRVEAIRRAVLVALEELPVSAEDKIEKIRAIIGPAGEK